MLTKGDQQRMMAMPQRTMGPPGAQIMSPGEAQNLLAQALAPTTVAAPGGIDLSGLKEQLPAIRAWLSSRGSVQAPQMIGGELAAAQGSMVNDPRASY